MLEEPLECSSWLRVVEGAVRIDEALVVEVGFNWLQDLRGVYSALNYDTKVPWATTTPAVGVNWDVAEMIDTSNSPSLFVQVFFSISP